MAGYDGLGNPVYDVALARKLLAEAGYANDFGFPETAILYTTSEGHKAIVEFLQQKWKNNLNITLELENQEWATYQSNRYHGNFQIARAGWVGDYQDPNTFLDIFVTGGSMNGGEYSNEFYDLLIREAATLDGPDRLDILFVTESILINEDRAIIPLYDYTTDNMVEPPSGAVGILTPWITIL
ncbi:MAG: ABC transporter substrate-binding protein [Sphaerochaetaceae bacterium]